MANLIDFLTSVQNLVKAFNAFTQSNIQLSGAANTKNLSETTLIKTGTGRIATLSVTTAGTAVGGLYDSATQGGATSATLLVVVPMDVGVFPINMAYQNGLVYVPGLGQTAAICYT
jgi:hypothetical protein